MRSRILCFVGLMLFAGSACAAFGAVDPTLIQQVGNTWYITPANDINVDGDNINAVLDSASPGDTIVLKAGTFRLGKTGAYLHTVDLPIPGWTTFSFPVASQPYLVKKKLTIRGEMDSKGALLTTLTSNHGLASSCFAVMMPGIVIRDLRFYRTRQAVRIWCAGVTVDHCIFEEGLGTIIQAFPDLRTVYPHYVPPAGNGNPAADPDAQYDFSDAVKTYLTHNKFINCANAFQGFPSELVVTDNDFGCREVSMYLTPGWRYLLMPLAGGICQNNLIRNNVFSGQTTHGINVCLAAYYTGILRNNEVSHNTFTDVFHGVEFYAYSEYGPSIVSSNTVAHNVFASDKGCVLVGSYWPTHEKFLVSNNIFEKMGRYALQFWAMRDSAIVGNNMQNLDLQWLYPDECHIYLEECERTTVVGESKNLVVIEVGGVDNVFVGVNNKKGAGGVGQRICCLMSDPELKGRGPDQHEDLP